jgi:2,3-bisphosphoglycerate-dependent phosphoglycerate mutase
MHPKRVRSPSRRTVIGLLASAAAVEAGLPALAAGALTKCYLIRHAQSQPELSLPSEFWPLSALGRDQAERLGQQLAHRGIEEIYSSPYPRAVDTVWPLAKALKLRVDLRYDLRERDIASSSPNSREMVRGSWANFDHALPGDETNRACQARMRGAILAIVKATRSSTIAIASHGQAIALFLNSLDPRFGFAQWEKMGNPEVFELAWDGTSMQITSNLL